MQLFIDYPRRGRYFLLIYGVWWRRGDVWCGVCACVGVYTLSSFICAGYPWPETQYPRRYSTFSPPDHHSVLSFYLGDQVIPIYLLTGAAPTSKTYPSWFWRYMCALWHSLRSALSRVEGCYFSYALCCYFCARCGAEENFCMGVLYHYRSE